MRRKQAPRPCAAPGKRRRRRDARPQRRRRRQDPTKKPSGGGSLLLLFVHAAAGGRLLLGRVPKACSLPVVILVATAPGKEPRKELLAPRRQDADEQDPNRRQRNAQEDGRDFQLDPDHADAVVPRRVQRHFDVRIRVQSQNRGNAPKRANPKQQPRAELARAIHRQRADHGQWEDQEHNVLHDGADADGVPDGGDVEARAFDVAVPPRPDGAAGEYGQEEQDECVEDDVGEHAVGGEAEARVRFLEDVEVEEDDADFEGADDGNVKDGADVPFFHLVSVAARVIFLLLLGSVYRG